MKLIKGGIEIRDTCLPEYGRHWGRLGDFTPLWKLAIYFGWYGFGYNYLRYDGNNYCLNLGLISIYWTGGGRRKK